MGRLDELLTPYAEGRGALVVLVIAFLLGLRHAADPDHLVAVSTLVAAVRERHARVGARIGLAWGAGHALSLVAFGLPVLLFHAWIPTAAQSLAEVLIGAIIAVLAVRLLLAWRRGAFHAHVHEHGGDRHAHLHGHAAERDHEHPHPIRTARQAFGIGTVHGLAGSAGVMVLLLTAVPSRSTAALALVLLAGGTAVTMGALSAGLGSLLGTTRVRHALVLAVPVLGTFAAVFGASYAAAGILAVV